MFKVFAEIGDGTYVVERKRRWGRRAKREEMAASDIDAGLHNEWRKWWKTEKDSESTNNARVGRIIRMKLMEDIVIVQPNGRLAFIAFVGILPPCPDLPELGLWIAYCVLEKVQDVRELLQSVPDDMIGGIREFSGWPNMSRILEALLHTRYLLRTGT
ncbi:hypothetical protein ABVK25_010784 [Lepraria finkii]|uniref:Uncharacterized protein n=1 Tax=Lepraria finkii TaxID=1340010 RepID=A0ABR4AW20_9LECA